MVLRPKAPSCIQNYDNIGFILGTSSDVFNELCLTIPVAAASPSVLADLTALINETHAITTCDEYAVYPNPFYNYAHSSLVKSQTS